MPSDKDPVTINIREIQYIECCFRLLRQERTRHVRPEQDTNSR